jgi:hypothetical protein
MGYRQLVREQYANQNRDPDQENLDEKTTGVRDTAAFTAL